MRHTEHVRPARTLASAALALLLLLAPAPAALAQGRPTPTVPPPAPPPRPRLVLLIAVDQFRQDYLERFSDLFAQNGLRRLMRDGGNWTRADYDHIPTETAPGHATMMTGAWPAETGIVGNGWYDRDRGRVVNNIFDPSSTLIGGGPEEPSASPRTLLVSTLGDELKLATNRRSKVFGISIKDRGAILPAGRLADGAYWFSVQTGRFVSSTYYANQLPQWITRFNEGGYVDRLFGAKWERLLCEGAGARPDCAAEYDRRAGRDDAPWEFVEAPAANTAARVFPHTITGGLQSPGRAFYADLPYSPFTNDLLVQLAEAAIAAEGLGADADTDVLTVSFSANDYVGHRFGPYSHESMDMTLRVDRQIGALLDVVERRVGLRNTLVAFTADHGVAPVPEQAAAMNLPGGRVKSQDVQTAIKNAVRARYCKGECTTDTTADYVLAFANDSVYFNPVALRRDGVSQEEIERVAGDAALTVPGVSRYFTRTQLMAGNMGAADPVARRALHGFHPRRSGDVVVIQEPFKYMVDYQITATHGTPYSYDTHVPLIIMGPGVAPGRYAQAATPADIAPTLAALLRVQSPSNATGRVLLEALGRN